MTTIVKKLVFLVAFASRSLNKAEKNYGVTDWEGLAVVWAIQHFEPYINGMKFTVVTNHSALKALKDKANLTGCLLRQADKLMEYNFDVVYQKGNENVVPDFLSRIYIVDQLDQDEEDDRTTAIQKNKIYVPTPERLLLIEKTHRYDTGHLRVAKLFFFYQRNISGGLCFTM